MLPFRWNAIPEWKRKTKTKKKVYCTHKMCFRCLLVRSLHFFFLQKKSQTYAYTSDVSFCIEWRWGVRSKRRKKKIADSPTDRIHSKDKLDVRYTFVYVVCITKNVERFALWCALAGRISNKSTTYAPSPLLLLLLLCSTFVILHFVRPNSNFIRTIWNRHAALTDSSTSTHTHSLSLAPKPNKKSKS